MQVRIEFPLSKALLLHLKVKIKGRGIMEIDVKYENFPHLCFSCVRLGHAAQICEGGTGITGDKVWPRIESFTAEMGWRNLYSTGCIKSGATPIPG
jgi:hypothetical protein